MVGCLLCVFRAAPIVRTLGKVNSPLVTDLFRAGLTCCSVSGFRCQERCVEGLSALLQRVAESALEAQGARSSTRLSEVGRVTVLM